MQYCLETAADPLGAVDSSVWSEWRVTGPGLVGRAVGGRVY